MGTGECEDIRLEEVRWQDEILFGPNPRTILCEVMRSALVSEPRVWDRVTPLAGLLMGAVDEDDCEAR